MPKTQWVPWVCYFLVCLATTTLLVHFHGLPVYWSRLPGSRTVQRNESFSAFWKAWLSTAGKIGSSTTALPRIHSGAKVVDLSAQAGVPGCDELVEDPPRIAWMIKTAPQLCSKTGRCGEIHDTWAARALCYNQTVSFMDAGPVRPQGMRPDVQLEFLPYSGSHLNAFGRKEMWQWKTIRKLHPEVDWVAAADDDTYFLVDNILRWLKTLNSSKPVALGRRFRIPGSGLLFNSGGAGIILSHAGLTRAVSFLDTCAERWGLGPGDTCSGSCWKLAGVELIDTRDPQGRERFHPFQYKLHSTMAYVAPDDWYYKYSVSLAPLHEGRDCCGANETVSFHYMSGFMRKFAWPPKLPKRL